MLERDGRSPPINVAWVRFWPCAICGLSLLLVLALLGFSGFSPSTKPNTSNSNSTGIEDPHENQLGMMCLPLYMINMVFYLLASN